MEILTPTHFVFELKSGMRVELQIGEEDGTYPIQAHIIEHSELWHKSGITFI